MRLVWVIVFALAACGGAHKGPADLVEADAWDDLEADEADDDVRPAKPSPASASPAAYVPRSDGGRASSKPRYRGAKIDLDLKDAELHNVFRLLADVGGVNIVVSDEVHGSVTMRLKQVPWDQALHTIVRAKQLTLEEEQGMYLVMPKGSGR